MSTLIESVRAWEALDSRGRPTVGCRMRLRGGGECGVVVPAGASTGAREARELRDGGPRHAGHGVRQAVRNVNDVIGPVVRGFDAADQTGLDDRLRAVDGTPDLRRLGANAVLAVSLVAALARADQERTPLFRLLASEVPPLIPMPMVNIVSGGAHAAGAVDIQDVLFVPLGAGCFAEAIEWAARVRACAQRRVGADGLGAALAADEGGIGVPMPSNRAAVALVAGAIEDAGLTPGEQGGIAIDVAANQLAVAGGYEFAAERRRLSRFELMEELAAWCDAFPVVSIEDPFAEEDTAGWDAAAAHLAPRLQLLGDDLLATNADLLAAAAADGRVNAILVKPNQNGTLSGTLDVLRLARAAGVATVVSARSGDTEDAWLADLAVGTGAGQIKVGSTTRGERTAKWNRLLEIEALLAPDATYAGRTALGGGP